MNCKDHPMAPHGFLRQASHNAGRYVCECEWWDEKGYELATLEEAEAFAEKRNYHYTNTDNPIDFPKNCPWDNWKATKDIV
jgi:hypothetical protein